VYCMGIGCCDRRVGRGRSRKSACGAVFRDTPNFAHVIDGCVGDVAIAEGWHSHFTKLYNSCADDLTKSHFYRCLNEKSPHASDVCDVVRCLQKQKRGKIAGRDNIAKKALIFGGFRLCVYCLNFYTSGTFAHILYTIIGDMSPYTDGTVASVVGVVGVGVCNRSQMRTSKCTCLCLCLNFWCEYSS